MRLEKESENHFQLSSTKKKKSRSTYMEFSPTGYLVFVGKRGQRVK